MGCFYSVQELNEIESKKISKKEDVKNCELIKEEINETYKEEKNEIYQADKNEVKEDKSNFI